MNNFPLLVSLLLALYFNETFGQTPPASFSQDEPSTSKHRHAVEHLEPDPAKTIFNVMAGKNPLRRTTTAAPRTTVPSKKHAGNVNIQKRGRRSTDQKENLDREYDVLVSDFNEDEKPESVSKDQAVIKPAASTMEPKWTTRVVGSAEILDPRAIEAPIHRHRVAVPAHLVERVRESLETEEAETPLRPTTLSATQRALNLFVPVTGSTTQKTTTNSEAGSIDDASGQEPATTASVNKDLLRSVLATKLSKLFVAPDLEQPKVAKSIIPNKSKGPTKTTVAATTILQQTETTKSSTTVKAETSASTTNSPKPTKIATQTSKSTTTQKLTTASKPTTASAPLKLAEQKIGKGAVQVPSSSFQSDDEFVEEHRVETQEVPATTQQQTEPTTRVPNQVLDGTVVKRRRVLSNFVQSHLHRSFGLVRRRRQVENSSTEIQPSTTTPLSTTPQRDAIQAQELEPRTTTTLSTEILTNETTLTETSTKTSTAAPKIKDGEFRDIALSETAAGVSDQKQGLVRESEGKQQINLNLEEPQRASTAAPIQTPVQQPVGQFQQRGWAPPAQVLPQQQAGFVQPIFNHFVVGNRRFVIPSITYEQHVAQQQQQFWPQQQFVPPPQPAQPPQPVQPVAPMNFQQFVPQNQPTPIQPNPPPQNPVQSFNPPPQNPVQTTPQRPILPATTEAPLVRTTEANIPNIIHTTTPLAKEHVRGVGEKGVDFDLYDETASANRQ